MNVGLFGGSFDPPHLAHLIVAETVRDRFGLDRICWMPNYQPPHKADHLGDTAGHRLEMTRLATLDHPAFFVSTLELERRGTSYTIDTICALQAAHPDTSFHLILGSDSHRSFSSWHRPDDIVRRVPLIVYPRPDADPGDAADRYPGRVHRADAPLLEISSEVVRARLRAGHSIRYLVPDAVCAYIEAHNLYQDA
jgi:nicotinate-nucleotide adenylyltransferase